MDEKEGMQSKTMKRTTVVIGVLLVAFVSFAGGLAVGFHKARFSYAFGENYERNFMGRDRDEVGGEPRMMPFGAPRNFDGSGFRNGHGLIGEVISLSGHSVVVKDPSGKENIVALSDETLVRGGRDEMKIVDLQTGNKIAVIGKPGDDGTVNADFIRVLSEPETK